MITRTRIRSSWSHCTHIAVKAVTAAQLSMASDGVYSVTLDEAIEAMRLTATDMSVKYKETSMSVRTLDSFRLEYDHGSGERVSLPFVLWGAFPVLTSCHISDLT